MHIGYSKKLEGFVVKGIASGVELPRLESQPACYYESAQATRVTGKI